MGPDGGFPQDEQRDLYKHVHVNMLVGASFFMFLRKYIGSLNDLHSRYCRHSMLSENIMIKSTYHMFVNILLRKSFQSCDENAEAYFDSSL